jgi:ABC-type transport system involved in multi-copper enzyme maturation permease subunit
MTTIFSGYMLLYLMAIQTLALFSSHLFTTKISASAFTIFIFLLITSVGGYMIHSANVPKYMKFLEFASPYKWLLPILTENEFNSQTIASTTGQQLCRNKQVIDIFEQKTFQLHF